MLETKDAFAGNLRYTPRIAWDEALHARLRQFLIASGLVSEPENPCVVADWVFTSPSQRSNVLVYRDGGDAEPPACLLYREDRPSRLRWVHLPPPEEQEALCAAWDWAAKLSSEKLALLRGYAQRALASPDAWLPFDLPADSIPHLGPPPSTR